MGKGLSETTKASQGKWWVNECCPVRLWQRAWQRETPGMREKPRSCDGPERSQAPWGQAAFANSLGRSVPSRGDTYLSCPGCTRAAAGAIAALGLPRSPRGAAGMGMLGAGSQSDSDSLCASKFGRCGAVGGCEHQGGGWCPVRHTWRFRELLRQVPWARPI